RCRAAPERDVDTHSAGSGNAATAAGADRRGLPQYAAGLRQVLLERSDEMGRGHPRGGNPGQLSRRAATPARRRGFRRATQEKEYFSKYTEKRRKYRSTFLSSFPRLSRITLHCAARGKPAHQSARRGFRPAVLPHRQAYLLAQKDFPRE